MTAFLTNLAFFYALVFCFLGYMLFDASRKTGSLANAIAHYRNTENGSLAGIVMAAFGFPIIVAGALTLMYFMINEATADDELRYLTHTTLFAGLDNTFKTSPQCYAGGVNDTLTSNLGVQQHLIGYGDVDLYAKYQHHSCATNQDSAGYDAYGLGVSWTFSRK